MAVFRPVELYGLTVPAGDDPIPAIQDTDFPATFRITMAAIDPTAKPILSEQVNGEPAFNGATLKIIRVRDDESESSESDDDDDDDYDMAGLLDDGSDEDDEDDSADEPNGGPSDPERSEKARRRAAVDRLKEALANDEHLDDDDDEDEDEMDLDGPNGHARLTAKEKGKGRAVDAEDEDEDEDDSDLEPAEPEEFVLCTLDPSKNYQQPLDITINEHEAVFFKVTGTHNIYLTGNIVIPEDPGPGDLYDPEEDEEDGDFDLPPDEDELNLPDEDDESDELDDIDDPRVTEIDSENDEVAPQLAKVVSAPKKGKNKRPAEDLEEDNLEKGNIDDVLSKSLKPEDAQAAMNGDIPKLSKSQLKKQRKKMKDNLGNAVEATTTTTASKKDEDLGVKESTTSAVKQSAGKADKKVSFAETLVQGPTGSTSPKVDATKLNNHKTQAAPGGSKPSLGVKNVQGVTVDDRKLGQGQLVKKGDKVSMRYIGKLEKDKSVFDSNKKGKPFTCTVGSGQVIKGMDLGVVGMSVGGERRITIPANLAYGAQSQPGIPANSTLIFDLKLLDIN